MLMPTKMKLEEGLPDARILVHGAFVQVPCKFRFRGLCIVAATEVSQPPSPLALYSVTHEASGMQVCPPVTDPMHALTAAAALLGQPVDWTLDTDNLYRAIEASPEETRQLIAALMRGEVKFQKLERA